VVEFDGGQTMFESAAICLYLGDLFPPSGLLPEFGSLDRPLVFQWVLYAMTEVETTVAALGRAKREGENETEYSDRFAELLLSSRRLATGRGSSAIGSQSLTLSLPVFSTSSAASSAPTEPLKATSTSRSRARRILALIHSDVDD